MVNGKVRRKKQDLPSSEADTIQVEEGKEKGQTSASNKNERDPSPKNEEFKDGRWNYNSTCPWLLQVLWNEVLTKTKCRLQLCLQRPGWPRRGLPSSHGSHQGNNREFFHPYSQEWRNIKISLLNQYSVIQQDGWSEASRPSWSHQEMCTDGLSSWAPTFSSRTTTEFGNI